MMHSSKRSSSRSGGEGRAAVDDVLAQVDNLPTLPLVAITVGDMVNDPGATARDISGVLQRDPSLSAKVLRLVNSPYYAIPGGVGDVQRAISFIGFNTLHQLVLSVSVLSALRTPAGSRFNARGLWLHSLAVGACAEVIATHIGYRDPGVCFTAGLMHDIGKIALAKAMPERFGAALDEASKSGTQMAVAERGAGLPSHDKVGSRLARKWKFPAPLLCAIEHHHGAHRPQVRRELAPAILSVVDIVAVSDEISRFYAIGDSGSPAPEKQDMAALERVGLSTIQAERIHSDLMRKLEVSKTFLTLIDGDD